MLTQHVDSYPDLYLASGESSEKVCGLELARLVVFEVCVLVSQDIPVVHRLQ